MRTTLFLTLVLALSCASLAQSNRVSWANLSGLKPGQKIEVVETNSKKHSGAFESVSDSAISLRDATGEASVPKQDVRSVKLIRNRRLRNTLIGLGVGAGGGAAIGAGIGPSNGFIIGKGASAAIEGLFGAVCGAAVGALLPTHDSIYSTPAH